MIDEKRLIDWLRLLLMVDLQPRTEAAIKHLDEEAERFFAKARQHGIEGNYDQALEAKKAGTDCKLDADLLRWSWGQKQDAFGDEDFGLEEEK